MPDSRITVLSPAVDLRSVAWNLVLAGAPVLAGWALGAVIRGRAGRRRLLVGLLLGAIWMALLPNTAYLLTGWRHFSAGIQANESQFTIHGHPGALLWLLVLLACCWLYNGFGAVTMVLATRPVAAAVRERGWPLRAAAAPFFLLLAFGVHLGLSSRANSWDLLTRPAGLTRTVLATESSATTAVVIIGLAVALWLIYLIVDIWLDGLALRWQRYHARQRSDAGAQ